MMISPYFIYLAFLFFFLVLYWGFNFTVIYHLARFGVGVQPKKIAAIFFMGSIVLFFLSVSLFASIDFEGLGQSFLANQSSSLPI